MAMMAIISNQYCFHAYHWQFAELQDLLPGIINQLGQEHLKKLAAAYTNQGGDATKQEDDDVPDLVDNFEETAKEGAK